MACARWPVALSILMMCHGCSLSDHRVVQSRLGGASSAADMEKLVDEPGPIAVETIISADWTLPLGGLLNLKSPAAQAAHLTDHQESIHVFTHVLRHPKFGIYLVDTGVSQQFLDDLSGPASLLIRAFLPLDQMQIRNGTSQILAHSSGAIQGVFFTHLHVDHIAGMPDIPGNVPLYICRTESTQTAFQNIIARGITTRLLQGKADLQEWPFHLDNEHNGLAIGEIVDIFGDGSAFAISVPGHTPGSTAYILRTPKGPVLLTGDTSHTRWGWEHGVEPGSYTADKPMNRMSLTWLKDLVSRHPTMEVRLGHQ
jgi:N-acyl homoserine lactone hydrolase